MCRFHALNPCNVITLVLKATISLILCTAMGLIIIIMFTVFIAHDCMHADRQSLDHETQWYVVALL